jgi:hypothetical protein
MRTFGAQLVEAVRNRRPGESVIAAFRTCLVAPRGLMASADADADETLQTLARIIAESPALLARERQIYEEATQSLAPGRTTDVRGARRHRAVGRRQCAHWRPPRTGELHP